MTDLQKNQAIYQAMCEIAEKYFNLVIQHNEQFRTFMTEKFIISVKELESEAIWNSAKNEIDFEEETIKVDTFSCTFKGDNVFHLMPKFKTLAKAKGDYLFTYEEELPNEYIGSVDITFENPTSAKNLTNHLSSGNELCPVFDHILIDVDTDACNINFVASNGKVLSVLSNDKDRILSGEPNRECTYQALFTKVAWKRICDYARKMKVAVRFEIYKRVENELQDTMIAILGDARIKSVRLNMRYANWRGVLQKNADKHFQLHPDEVKAAQKFVQSIRLANDYAKERQTINVSFYRGSDMAYFDYFDDQTTKTAAFRLTAPSSITIGVNLHLYRLQQIKFTAFNLQTSQNFAVIDCEEADFLEIVPAFREEGYVFDVGNREVTEVLEEALCVA